MIHHLFYRIRFATLKRKIRKNPYLGKEDIDGTYEYKRGSYHIRYRLVKKPDGQTDIKWVSLKRRLNRYEIWINRVKEGFFDFWHYQKWLLFLRPSTFLFLLIAILLFYSEVMETQEIKINRYKWIVASLLGVNPQDIQYIGNGWIEVSGQRRRIQDNVSEPIRYSFNPLRWLFFSEGCFMRRWRGEPFGYATHPLVYNERGDVWIHKDGTWKHGSIVGETIKWDIPVGSAMVSEQEKSIKDRKLEIIDEKSGIRK